MLNEMMRWSHGLFRWRSFNSTEGCLCSTSHNTFKIDHLEHLPPTLMDMIINNLHPLHCKTLEALSASGYIMQRTAHSQQREIHPLSQNALQARSHHQKLIFTSRIQRSPFSFLVKGYILHIYERRHWFSHSGPCSSSALK